MSTLFILSLLSFFRQRNYLVFLFPFSTFTFSSTCHLLYVYEIKLLSVFGVNCSLHFLKCSLSPKKSKPISIFLTFLFQSRNIFCLVISLSCVTSECLTILFLSIDGKFHIRYSTKSVSLTN